MAYTGKHAKHRADAVPPRVRAQLVAEVKGAISQIGHHDSEEPYGRRGLNADSCED